MYIPSSFEVFYVPQVIVLFLQAQRVLEASAMLHHEVLTGTGVADYALALLGEVVEALAASAFLVH